jgi:hypothetical protein
MREIVSIALLIGLAVCGIGIVDAANQEAVEADPGDPIASADPAAIDRMNAKLTDLLFSDQIDRIDFRATTFEEATVLVQTTTGRILDICVPLLGDAEMVAERSVEVIEALNTSAARGLALTFSNTKQDLIVESLTEADWLGEIVGETISIIHEYYGSGEISYRDKASNLFGRVRLNPEDSESLLLRHLETVQYVKSSSPSEQRKFLN